MARQDLVNAIQKGLQVRGSGPRGGCGRAYVYLSSTADKKSLNEFKAAIAANLRALGLPVYDDAVSD